MTGWCGLGELVPEIHDIGKLLWLRGSGQTWKHNIEDDLELFDKNFIKDNLTFRGILEHTCRSNYKEYPKRKETLILSIADDFAASTARPMKSHLKRGRYNVHKLWNPPPHEDFSLRKTLEINPKDEIWKKKVIDFLISNPSAEDYFKTFRYELRNRTEDSKKNLTSLYIHSKLTGKFYRILTKILKDEINEDIFKSSTSREICKKLKHFEGKTPLEITRIKINFNQDIARARDLNVLIELERIIQAIRNEFNDFLFFNFFNELIFITPKNSGLIDKIAEKAIQTGFWIEILGTRVFRYKELKDYRVMLFLKEKAGLKEPYNIWPDLPDTISSKICQVCQMAEATKILPKDELEDYLCETCYKIRKEPKLKKVGTIWEEENTDIVFLKVNIKLEELHKVLNNLYSEQFKSSEKVSLPVISEFQEDYDRFLYDLKRSIVKSFEIEDGLPFNDLMAIRMERVNDLTDIMRIIYERMHEHFPVFEGYGSPIKFVLTYSGIKFPFFEHFREIETYKSEVKIVVFGKGEMNLSIKQLGQILKVRIPRKTELHRLTAIAKDYKRLAEIMMKSKDYKRDYNGLQWATFKCGIRFDDLLTYLKIRGEEK